MQCEKSATWNLCYKERCNMEDCSLEDCNMKKKCNMKKEQHKKRHDITRAQHEGKGIMKTVQHEKSSTWKHWNMECTKIVHSSAETQTGLSIAGPSETYLGYCQRSMTEHVSANK